MTKEETKKIALGALGLIVLLYVYFSFFTGPLNRSRADIETRIAATNAKIASSKNDIDRARKIEQNARASLARNSALNALYPAGAPIAWFPPRLKTFFAGQQIDRPAVRLDGTAEVKEKDLEKWQRYTWNVDLPQVDFYVLGHALAELENTEPLLAIVKLSLHGAKEGPELQQAMFSATTLIEKK